MKPQAYIRQLKPYQPGLPIDVVAEQYGLKTQDIIKLASNENPLGASPRALAAIQAASQEVNRYPDPHELTNALAQKYSVQSDQIVLGCGSVGVFALIAQAYLSPELSAVSSQYAFTMYQIATQTVGAENIVVPAANFAHDLDAMATAITPQTSVVWIANPNNPTGTFHDRQAIEAFLAKVPQHVLVVLDQAYYEYLPSDHQTDDIGLLQMYPNVVITRTFSKIYGLAGLRVGYGIASAEVAEILNRTSQPFTVNNLAITGALAALQDDAFVMQSSQVNAAGQQQMANTIQIYGLEALPMHANFVTFRIAGALNIAKELLSKGVIVRPLANYGMPDWLRVTIGTAEENQRFLEVLKTIISAQHIGEESSY